MFYRGYANLNNADNRQERYSKETKTFFLNGDLLVTTSTSDSLVWKISGNFKVDSVNAVNQLLDVLEGDIRGDVMSGTINLKVPNGINTADPKSKIKAKIRLKIKTY